MTAISEPSYRIKCSYDDCYQTFETEREMHKHKKYSQEHDYCSKCKIDCEDFKAYVLHKITRPIEHNKACRVCGTEFKSDSGLRLHTEKNHQVNQRLTCIGCLKPFHNPHLFIEHLEFGHCDYISASQFQGHIVHKHLITELLKGGDAYARFQQKTSKFEATVDCEEEGGVNLEDNIFEDEDIDEVQYKAIKPDSIPDTPLLPAAIGPYPALPSSSNMYSSIAAESDLSSTLNGLSLNDELETSIGVNSPIASPIAASHPASTFHSDSVRQNLTSEGSTAASSSCQTKVWGSRSGKNTSNILFPGAKATPVPKEFSIEAYDNKMEEEHGLNIMRSRFWDPMSSDFNPERFYDSVMSKYYCPFVCEQNFSTASDLNRHIMNDHRITRMKCPSCLKYFKSASALMAHCESVGARCQINKAENFNIFLDRLSGGFLAVEEKTRPDHLNTPTVLITNEETGRIERYKPPTATYLQYSVTTPPDWKEPVRTTKVIGGLPSRQQPRNQW